ncbi:MAG: putative sigma-54 modulation protein [Pseudomonadota bacterium]|nr:putative sigma-54 modulation protein [Pseudomonadota bacterium]
MNIQITGHGVQVTSALKSFTEEKFAKLFEHYHHIQSCHITYEIEKLEQIAQATILYQKIEVHAKANAVDIYSAVDILLEKLKRQLEKIKETHLGHQE